MGQKLGWRCLGPKLGLRLALIGFREQELDPQTGERLTKWLSEERY